MLRRVEKPGLGITARRLPARDHGACGLSESTTFLGSEAQLRQPALHFAALSLVEAYLIFRFLGCLRGHWISGRLQAAVGRARSGIRNICTDQNSKERQCEDEDTQWLFSLILESLNEFALRT